MRDINKNTLMLKITINYLKYIKYLKYIAFNVLFENKKGVNCFKKMRLKYSIP